jgi:hypothetical protein
MANCATHLSLRRPVQKLAILAIFPLLLVLSSLLVQPESHAIPAFARKYNADCAMCHYPVVPRLNSFGQQFRRAGYRTPTEFDKSQDITDVSKFLSARLRTQLVYENDKGTVERSEFRFPDVSLFYAGALGRHFSAWIHVFAANSTNVDVHGHLMGMYGNADQYVSARIGQMHMLQQEGVGGFDRPTGISPSPTQVLALTSTSTLAGGQALAFHFDQRQKGVELAYIRGAGRVLVQVSNGLNQSGSGTANVGDIDPQKDYLVAYEHLLDDIASGFTVFYYNGTTHGVVTPTGTTGPPSSINQQFNYSRLGINISKIVPVADYGFFELQGGYIRSHDNNPQQVGSDVDGNAYYIESQQYFTGQEVTVYERYSWIDLNAARLNSARKDYTLGAVTPVQTWLRVTAEYTYTDNRFNGLTGHLALLEFQGNW